METKSFAEEERDNEVPTVFINGIPIKNDQTIFVQKKRSQQT